MKIAAIDVGSNSIKLVVIDAAASDSFAVLAREKDTVRLGHDTLRLEQLSPAAIERATDCIKRFRSIAEARGLSEQFIPSDPPKPKELKALREEVRAALERTARELKGTRWQHATGTSGTIVAIGTALRLRALSAEERQSEGARPAGD